MNSIHSALVTERLGELERVDQRLVARAFIVIGEALAVMADFENAAVEGDPVERRRMAGADAGSSLAVSGLKRLGGEQAQDVGEQKLLVLLLVIDAELDQLGRLRGERGIEQARQRLIDEGAIVAHLVAPRAA